MTLIAGAATRLIALLGDPVGHSLSPVFQTAALRAEGLDAVYVALRCAADDLPGLLRGIARAGGAGNVTVPHKALAARVVERWTGAAERTGTCNTFWLEDGRICGDNTDVAGFSAAARELLGGSLADARVLLLGAGGAASAVVAALQAQRAAEIVVCNRSPDHARSLVERFGGEASPIRAVADPASLAGEAFDLVVNATSLGLRPHDPSPLETDGGLSFSAALDLVYSPERTRWVRALDARGIPAADGLGMLLHQGAAAFERWWGRPAPMDAMRASMLRSI